MARHDGDEADSGRLESGGVSFQGSMTGGAITTGHNARIEQHTHIGTGEDQARLLQAVQQLREDLGRLRQTPAVTGLGQELTAAEVEIGRSGRASAECLQRLRDSMGSADDAVSLLASGGDLSEAIERMAGG